MEIFRYIHTKIKISGVNLRLSKVGRVVVKLELLIYSIFEYKIGQKIESKLPISNYRRKKMKFVFLLQFFFILTFAETVDELFGDQDEVKSSIFFFWKFSDFFRIFVYCPKNRGKF